MNIKSKSIEAEMSGNYTIDGAGVRLLRVFGGPSTFEYTDPFLLLDYFGSSEPSEYEKGFPWHPHRGIETITYQVKGKTDHEDSNGNKGTIYPGDVQDMSAGSGIFHQEMPASLNMKGSNDKNFDRTVLGLQLWVNTPAERKMKTPEYAYYKSSDIPQYKTDNGSIVKVFAGEFGDATGPYRSPYDLSLHYYHIRIKEGDSIELSNLERKRAIMFNFSGNVRINGETEMTERKAFIFSRNGDYIEIKGRERESDIMFIAGNPTDEHIEWYGPVVMNTREQLNEALKDLRNGTFVREKEPVFN
ncbi:MAG: pirin family protein [Candidatus Thermoplasmatota archaeon]|jgi:hypothetical protein|nr:pirin family protein [Candidatus Thermoplasmatota archaeon]MCL6014019.1 pirin family protein [Candidatus Thermoplasmatota archaeon]